MSSEEAGEDKQDAAACDGCGDGGRELADFEGKALCYYCWHAAREATPPYHVRSKSNPEHHYSHAAFFPVVYTLAEAESEAGRLNTPRNRFSSGPFDFEPVAATNWSGERLSHPGYLGIRRAAIQAQGGRSLPDEARGPRRPSTLPAASPDRNKP